MDKKFKMMVLMPSYNKEQYIEEAINSVLMQKVNFDLQLVVTDDGSTDNTINIVKNYIEKYPDKIVLLPSEKNQGLLSNIIKAYEYMNCEYFACLDADDYLTNENFYQKAIDFLENNSDFNIYTANTEFIYLDGKKYSTNSDFKEEFKDSTFEDMLNNKAILGNTISSVFRNNVIDKNLINKLKQHTGNHYKEHSFREDDFRNRIHLENSKAHFVNEVVGFYRTTNSGLYQGSNELKKLLLKVTSFIDMYYFFDKKYIKFLDLIPPYLIEFNQFNLKGDFNNILSYPQKEIEQLFRVFQQIADIKPSIITDFLDYIKKYRNRRNLNC